VGLSRGRFVFKINRRWLGYSPRLTFMPEPVGQLNGQNRSSTRIGVEGHDIINIGPVCTGQRQRSVTRIVTTPSSRARRVSSG